MHLRQGAQNLGVEQFIGRQIGHFDPSRYSMVPVTL